LKVNYKSKKLSYQNNYLKKKILRRKKWDLTWFFYWGGVLLLSSWRGYDGSLDVALANVDVVLRSWSGSYPIISWQMKHFRFCDSTFLSAKKSHWYVSSFKKRYSHYLLWSVVYNLSFIIAWSRIFSSGDEEKNKWEGYIYMKDYSK